MSDLDLVHKELDELDEEDEDESADALAVAFRCIHLL